MSHDQNFKNLILDYPRQALDFFAAGDPIEHLAEAEILPVRQEQLKERLGDRFRELDVPLLVQWPDGRREALLFVLEEESDPRRFSIHRLAHYCLDLGELLETDRVVPVVIFLRGRSPRYELIQGSDHQTYLSFRYLACELSAIAYERYRESDNIVARLNLPSMRYAPQDKIDAYAHAVRGLATLEEDPEKQLKYIDFIDIYAVLDDNERARYERDYPEESEIMSTFAERFIQQGWERGKQEGALEGRQAGRQEGRREGRREGRQEGEAAMLSRLLQLKFGELPPQVLTRIGAADVETLLVWSERVLITESLERIFDEND
ncbi:DUF4351 domain-containing protein [Imhoffiella purpurea]|uniref:DUF4351 domain-containing protein n=1 Tax=Imhoffiella purpurea TaxID=1249627 RepID=W9VAW8_9GAMM|nr:DUF4351 domain-containing protein [Imhoffiella purpurea]EXJ14076.1 hypothetical protein D779_3038 [Imhoffiella purpurea]